MNRHPTNGVFQPEELVALKNIYDEVTRQRWFAKDETTRRSFAKYLFE